MVEGLGAGNMDLGTLEQSVVVIYITSHIYLWLSYCV